jgi:putative inorganic carbon (hco3(-)) transporter
MAFYLFVLLNAVLFIRPAEIVPDLEAMPLYSVLLYACLATSGLSVLHQLSPRVLVGQPITVCVLGLLVAVVLSHLAHLLPSYAWEQGRRFTEPVAYFLLFVAIVNTPRRLYWFLFWLLVFILVLTVLAVLHYRGTIELPIVAAVQQRVVDRETGEVTFIARLQSTGIYSDPNDLCTILVVGMVLCLYFWGDRRFGAARHLWLTLLVPLGYALMLTQSRGGLLAVGVGFLVLVVTRFGWKKAAPLAILALPALFLAMGGPRGFDLSDKDDTGHARMDLWHEGLQEFQANPLFGIGANQYADEVGQVAHNSYVHAYVELGLFGGTLFVGAFYLAFLGLYRLSPRRTPVADLELARLRPYMFALLAAYATGLWGLSRCYIAPTYTMLALVGAYAQMAAPPSWPVFPRVDGLLVRRLVLVGIAALAGIYAFLRVFLK